MSLNKYLTDLNDRVSMPHGATHVPYSPGSSVSTGYDRNNQPTCGTEWRKLVDTTCYYWNSMVGWVPYSATEGSYLTPIPIEFIMDKFVGEL